MFTKELRRRILGRWGSACIYCGKAANTLDHVYALSDFGSDRPLNLRPACRGCNTLKSRKDPVRFMRETLGMTEVVVAYVWGCYQLDECLEARDKIYAWYTR